MVVQEAISPEEGNRAPSKHEKKHRLKQRFEVVKKLGQGTYGKVQLAINKETNQEVAIKTIKKSKIESEQDLIRIRREIQIMSSIQHPHIIHIYEVFENKEKIVLIMQYASGGELYDYLSEKKILNDVEARRIFRQIAAAVYYCHKNKICHRDLKLENVLLDEKGNAKIADFGLSNVYDEKHLLDTFCGSPLYASPEIVKGVPYYGPEVDCWSMGVILYTLVYGAMPFDGSNFKRLVKQISEGDYYEPTKKAEASQLINRLLHVNPAKRATIIDICTDWWVNEGYEHSLLQVSEDLANLTPVRIDLLVALAPASSAPQGKDTQNPLASSNDNKSCPKLPEEEANRNEDDAETITDSFTFLDGRTDSHQSASFPNLPNLDETDDEFIPAGLAAELDGQYSKRQAEQSFDGSLTKVSSIAHKTKKPRKSSSSDTTQTEENKVSDEQDHNANVQPENVNKDQNNNDPRSDTTNEILDQAKESSSTNTETKVIQEESNKVEKSPKQKKSKQIKGSNTEKVTEQNEENKCTEKRRQSMELNEEKVSIPGGRKPGKIMIPKFLESPETSPKTAENILLSQVNEKSESKIKKREEKEDQNKQNSLAEEQDKKQTEDEIKDTDTTGQSEEKCQNINETSVASTENDKSTNSEAKKVTAKGILKKNIAKARLLEKRLSQQSSVESEGTPSSPTGQSNSSPPLTGESQDVSKGPSFFKVPQPYSKNINDKPVQSKAEIVITSSKNENSPQSESSSHHEETESIWGTPLSPPVKSNKQNQIVQKRVEWGTSTDIEQNSNNWKEQAGQSLMRLCPEEDDDDEFACTKHMGPTPITRSYKKFTFTKEGTCITETGKIYTKPGADGSWTKVEKKTKITTLPGNDEFQKFEHVQVRDESSLARSDSQSSSGSNDIFDDIFDSWTGDSMLCNFLKVKDNIKKFSRGPLLWRDRRRDPFKHFNTPTQKSKEWLKENDTKDTQPGEWEASDNDEDFDVHFDDMHPVVYGSQGLWQLLMSVNKDLPHHLRNFREPPQLGGFTRSISRDRGAGLLKKQNQYSSRASSGYGTRSLSRERSQSPRERVLKFVVESPQRQQSVGSNEPVSSPSQDLWYSKTPTSDIPERRCRKDSGVESCTSAESEAIRQSAPPRFSSRDGGARYSSFDDTFGPRTYKQYVKSFSKDTSSDRQNSLEEQYPQSPFDNLTDSRRHRVEQWLHMTDIDDFDSPFEEFARHHEVFSRSESPKTSLYGTMRPRSFMKYNRSVSDKLTDADSPFIPNLQENQYNQGIEGQNNRSYRSEISVDSTGNVQSSTFKTVSGADYATARIPMHSHSGTSFRAQQCDSDENTHKQYTTSSQQNSPHATKYTRSFSGNLQFGPQEGGISSRGQNRPILSMTVSFNRGGSDGPVIVQSNTPRQHSVNTGGLWQQQEFSSGPGRITIRREFSDPTSESPHINTVPTQRYYSTQESDRGPASSFSQPRADGSIPIKVWTTKTTRMN